MHGSSSSWVETAGQILDLVRDATALYPKIDVKEIAVVLVHSQDHLLPTMTRRLSEYCARVLRRRGDGFA